MFEAAYYQLIAVISGVDYAVRFTNGKFVDEDAYVWLQLKHVSLTSDPIPPRLAQLQACRFACVKFTHLLLGQRLQIGDTISVSGRAQLDAITLSTSYQRALEARNKQQAAWRKFLTDWQRRHVTKSVQPAFAALTERFLSGNWQLAPWLAAQRRLLRNNPALATLQHAEAGFILPALSLDPVLYVSAVIRDVLLVPSPLARLAKLETPRKGFSQKRQHQQLLTYFIETAKYRAWQRQQSQAHH
ncbi:hypothetical protein [Lacticaseibacillus jixiensis]|uniref:hypothetical protein n=1 Tax=Lacticaseibacillus jixiensis TaxID=3231926 RepID=UPI0036F1F16E